MIKSIKIDGNDIEVGSEIDIATKIAYKLITKLDSKKRVEILDVGCGTGRFGAILKKMMANSGYHINIYGTDVDYNALTIAKDKYKGVFLLDLDKNDLPFTNNLFDLVVCLDVIEHIKNPYKLLENIDKILKSKGFLILSTPNVQWIYHIIRLCFGYGPKTFGHTFKVNEKIWDGGHLHYFTLKDINIICKESGFEIIDVVYSWNVLSLTKLFELIAISPLPKFIKNFTQPAFIVVAKKK